MTWRGLVTSGLIVACLGGCPAVAPESTDAGSAEEHDAAAADRQQPDGSVVVPEAQPDGSVVVPEAQPDGSVVVPEQAEDAGTGEVRQTGGWLDRWGVSYVLPDGFPLIERYVRADEIGSVDGSLLVFGINASGVDQVWEASPYEFYECDEGPPQLVDIPSSVATVQGFVCTTGEDFFATRAVVPSSSMVGLQIWVSGPTTRSGELTTALDSLIESLQFEPPHADVVKMTNMAAVWDFYDLDTEMIDPETQSTSRLYIHYVFGRDGRYRYQWQEEVTIRSLDLPAWTDLNYDQEHGYFDVQGPDLLLTPDDGTPRTAHLENTSTIDGKTYSTTTWSAGGVGAYCSVPEDCPASDIWCSEPPLSACIKTCSNTCNSGTACVEFCDDTGACEQSNYCERLCLNTADCDHPSAHCYEFICIYLET